MLGTVLGMTSLGGMIATTWDAWDKSLDGKITNFREWRLKKALVFLCCMILSLILLSVFKNDELGTLLFLLGLLLYSIIIRQPFISDNSSVINVLSKENEIKIKGLKKEVKIEKGNIIRIVINDIYYGGKWLDVVGKRLIIYTKDKKYIFDFEICDDKELPEKENDYKNESLQCFQFKKILEKYM